ALGDADRVRRLAERRLTLTMPPSSDYEWSVHVLGLAYYRADQHQKAVARLETGLKERPEWFFNVFNWLVLALAHHQLKHHEQARQWFDKASAWMAQTARPDPGEEGGFTPAGWRWRDWLGARMLLHEAEEVLNVARKE